MVKHEDNVQRKPLSRASNVKLKGFFFFTGVKGKTASEDNSIKR